MSAAGVDLPALERYFADRVGTAGPLHAELITGGKSNLTYRLTDGERTWVLRRPPHEYRVVRALHGSGVPVAEPIALCEDPSNATPLAPGCRWTTCGSTPHSAYSSTPDWRC